MSDFDWSQCSPKDLAESYLKYRDAKAAFEERVKECKAVMEEIQAAMLAHMHENGTDSYRVDGVATVSRTIKTNVSCSDWNIFFNWMLNRANALRESGQDPTQVFAFLQKRVSSTAIKEFMDTDGANTPPPAVNVLPEYSVSVRITK